MEFIKQMLIKIKCTVFLKINARLIENVDVTQVVEHLMHKVHVEKTSVTRYIS